ncbi:MAG: hypothetical protein V8S12_04865 [Lachnospiraceae bacterium]
MDKSAGIQKRRSRKHAQLAEFWRRYRKNKAAVAGLVILILIVGTALFADLIVPYSKCIDQVSGALADSQSRPFLRNR